MNSFWSQLDDCIERFETGKNPTGGVKNTEKWRTVSKSPVFWFSAFRPPSTMKRLIRPALPDAAIVITTYEDLSRYLAKFADGELNLVLLLGQPGTGKSDAVKRALGAAEADGYGDQGDRVLYVEGHAQPFGLYQGLWRYRDCPVVLDDLDRLYTHPSCIRLLKALCNGTPCRRLTWLSQATISTADVPQQFATSSHVILIANEWRSLNADVRALEDRAIILSFQPSKQEIHRKVAEWFDDPDVFGFVGSYLPHLPGLSMRFYDKGRRLKRAGFTDWRKSLLQMMLPDRTIAALAGLLLDPTLTSDADRIARFMVDTGLSRATYYRIKKQVPQPVDPPPLVLRRAAKLRLVGTTNQDANGVAP